MSVFSISYWIKRGYSEEQAKQEVSKRRPTNILYWINKGFSEEEAAIKLYKFQQSGSKNKTKDDYRRNSVRCIEYYLSRGYSKEDASTEIKKIQNTFSLDICIQKWGPELGRKKWENRQTKWQKTLNDKPDEQKRDINRKKASISYSNLKQKHTNEEIQKILLETRNISLVLTIEDFRTDLKKMLNDNPDLYYSTPQKVCKKIPKIQFDILNIEDQESFVSVYLSKHKDIIYSSNSKQAYRKWVGDKLLRSSYEIKFYDFLQEKNILCEIDSTYPNSSLRYDFYLPKYNVYIEIAPMYDHDEKYKLKMDKKKSIFNCIILKNINEMVTYIEGLVDNGSDN